LITKKIRYRGVYGESRFETKSLSSPA